MKNKPKEQNQSEKRNDELQRVLDNELLNTMFLCKIFHTKEGQELLKDMIENLNRIQDVIHKNSKHIEEKKENKPENKKINWIKNTFFFKLLFFLFSWLRSFVSWLFSFFSG